MFLNGINRDPQHIDGYFVHADVDMDEYTQTPDKTLIWASDFYEKLPATTKKLTHASSNE